MGVGSDLYPKLKAPVLSCAMPRVGDLLALWDTVSQGVKPLQCFWVIVPAYEVSELLGNLCPATQGLRIVLCSVSKRMRSLWSWSLVPQDKIAEAFVFLLSQYKFSELSFSQTVKFLSSFEMLVQGLKFWNFVGICQGCETS